MPTVPVTGRFDLTGGQWAVLEPLLPRGEEAGTPADLEQAAADRRDPVAGPRRHREAVPAEVLRDGWLALTVF